MLASGAKPPNPTEILQSRVTHDLIRRLRQSYDMIIIDAPPLLPVADASVLATLSDGAILVIRHGQTTRDQVTEAVNRVNQVGGRLYGVVVNMVAKRAIGSYYYYYYEETSPVRDSKNKDTKGKSKAKLEEHHPGSRDEEPRRAAPGRRCPRAHPHDAHGMPAQTAASEEDDSPQPPIS